MDGAGDGGTGSPGNEHFAASSNALAAVPDDAGAVAGAAVDPAQVPTAGEPSPAAEGVEESVADIREDPDLCEYARTLGVDPAQDEDLLWVVQEAFNAPLPGSWAEFADETGRIYYFHDASSKTTWEHPMDEVFRELLALIKQTRIVAGASEAQRLAVVREHLQQVHARALRELQVWSGPYESDQGQYYYNDALKASTWESPVTELQNELTARHDVLTRCLLYDHSHGGVAAAALVGGPAAALGSGGGDLLETLRLPLGLVRRESCSGDVPLTPSTARTFYTARSAASSRSKHSAKSDRSKRSGHKKEHRSSKDPDHRSSRSRHKAEETQAMPPMMPPEQPQPNVFQAVD